MKNKYLAIFGGLLFGLFTVPTYAGTVTAHLDTVAPSATVSMSFVGGSYTNSPYVGRIAWTNVTNNSGVATFSAPFYSFCIEGTQDVYLNQNATFNVLTDIAQSPKPGSGMGTIKAGLVEKFWSLFYDQTTSNVGAAAFQLGIWELRYDGLADRSTGYFGVGDFRAKDNSAVVHQAAQWLNDVDTLTPTKSYDFYVLSSNSLQDQIVDDVRVVPLPAALPMGLSLLGGIGLIRKLRRNA